MTTISAADLAKLKDLLLSYHDGQCYACGWTLATSIDNGCLPGNCSFRPSPGTARYNEWRPRQEFQCNALAILDKAKEAQGAEPDAWMYSVRHQTAGSLRREEFAAIDWTEPVDLAPHESYELLGKEPLYLRPPSAPDAEVKALLDAADVEAHSLECLGSREQARFIRKQSAMIRRLAGIW